MTLRCGPENVLSNVDEPSTCEYSMTFTTPAACDLSHADGLRLDLPGEDEGLSTVDPEQNKTPKPHGARGEL